MSSERTHAERLAAVEEYSRQLKGFLDRFEAAFDELHEAVVKKNKTVGQYVGRHHDYPKMSMLDSGFPHFSEYGFYDKKAPSDFLSTMRPEGLFGFLSGYRRPEAGFPSGSELATFLRSNDIGKRLKLNKPIYNGQVSDWRVDHLVGDAVERYLHLYGLDSPVDRDRRHYVLKPLMRGTVSDTLELRLVVPIALAHFDVDHFQLSETTYISRIPKKLQLARARLRTLGTGAEQLVVGAATHAFVSNGWQLEVDDVDEVQESLAQFSHSAIDAIENFFGALRVATGVNTGYAQMLWVPRKWALGYFCDLTPIYGKAVRQYPNQYDNYGWLRRDPAISSEELTEVRRIYRAVATNSSEGIRLALRRLNMSFTRSDNADSILDSTIGLELLLGDDQNQSLSYKLRLRAGALSLLHASRSSSPKEVAAKVKRLYAARSSIVHGLKKKESKNAAEPADARYADERETGSELLRFVLDALLTHPQYQNPAKIDEGLLLRGDGKSHEIDNND